jgi:hypothetical protein
MRRQFLKIATRQICDDPREFVTGLTMLSFPTVYEQLDWDPGRQLFKGGYFTIRGTGNVIPIFNAQIGVGGGHFQYYGSDANSIVDGNFPYKGALEIRSVRKGSTWRVSVSDIPNVRVSDAAAQVSDKAAPFERNLLPRQLNNSRRDAINRPA